MEPKRDLGSHEGGGGGAVGGKEVVERIEDRDSERREREMRDSHANTSTIICPNKYTT